MARPRREELSFSTNSPGMRGGQAQVVASALEDSRSLTHQELDLLLNDFVSLREGELYHLFENILLSAPERSRTSTPFRTRRSERRLSANSSTEASYFFTLLVLVYHWATSRKRSCSEVPTSLFTPKISWETCQ